MMYAGEDLRSTEGAKLSGVSQEMEPYIDTTLESPLNGRRRCKDARLHPNLSGQRTEKIHTGVALLFIICFVFSSGVSFTPVFYLLRVAKRIRRCVRNVGDFELD